MCNVRVLARPLIDLQDQYILKHKTIPKRTDAHTRMRVRMSRYSQRARAKHAHTTRALMHTRKTCIHTYKCTFKVA